MVPGGTLCSVRGLVHAVNTWSHLAYVFDGEDVRVYINGRFAPDRCGYFALGPDLGTTFQIVLRRDRPGSVAGSD